MHKSVHDALIMPVHMPSLKCDNIEILGNYFQSDNTTEIHKTSWNEADQWQCSLMSTTAARRQEKRK